MTWQANWCRSYLIKLVHASRRPYGIACVEYHDETGGLIEMMRPERNC